jgi:hypothetical protein
VDEMEGSIPWLDGWHAHRLSKGAENPYNEETQSCSHWQWMMGHCRRRDA